MNAQVKPIETQYKGYRFRSRLEARWAVFFDTLGYDWEYEPEGFELAGGERYLPDFRVEGWWVEVKPMTGGLDQFEKAQRFAEQSGEAVLGVAGLPETVVYPLFWPDSVDTGAFAVGKYAPVYYSPEEDVGQSCRGNTFLDPNGTAAITRAVTAARSARFEFGESGAPA
jgi:hypothetical protein